MYQYSKIGDTVYFHFASNSAAGDGTDATTALFQVREAGATASNTPTYISSPTLLSNALYPDGCYEISVPATTVNSFVEGRRYAVFCNVAVSSHTPSGLVGAFALAPVPASVESLAMGYNRIFKVGTGHQYSEVASVVASPGDLVICYPGYSGQIYPIGATGVSYFFSKGSGMAPASGSPGALFGHGCTVLGQGTFTPVEDGTLVSGSSGADFYLEGDHIDLGAADSGGGISMVSTVGSLKLKIRHLLGSGQGPSIATFGGSVSLELDFYEDLGNPLINSTGGHTEIEIKNATIATSILVAGTGGQVVLSGNYTCSSTVSSGINAPSGVTLVLLQGAVTVPATRPSLSGVGKILVTEAFAYDYSAATASNVIASRGEEMLNRIPTTNLGDFIETHVSNVLATTTIDLDSDDLASIAQAVWNVLATDASSVANSIGTGLVASNATLVKLLTAMQQDGLVWQFTANALETAPSPSSVTAQVDLMELLYSNSLTAVDYSGRTGKTTLKSVLIDKTNKVFNTGTNSFDTLLDSINWSTAVRTMTEVLGQAGAGMGIYRNSIPTQVPIGTYTVIVQDGSGPSAERLVTEMIFWDGQSVVPISGALSTTYTAIQSRSNLGTGALSKTVTITSHSGAPIANMPVWISLDAQGQSKIAGPMLTDDLGKVTFMLNPGSYYAWGQGYNTNVDNPRTVTVP